MRYWIDSYWPHRPDEQRWKSKTLWIYYHEGKLDRDKKIQKGDKVLFYEPERHPDNSWPGAMTVFAAGTVSYGKGESMPPNIDGDRKWIWKRAVGVDRIVPEAAGVPFSEFKRIVGWEGGAIRSGPIEITQQQFQALYAMLADEPLAGIRRLASAPRQPDPEKRALLEKHAVSLAIEWYRKRGYKVRSVERDNLGWDLEAETEGHTLLVEVKGLSGSQLAVSLTPNEYRAMGRVSLRPRYRLFVVTSGFGEGHVAEFFYDPDTESWTDGDGRKLDFREITGAVATAVPL